MATARFDKFTERARKVLALAQEEAQRSNHNYIGPEHILLGLIREGSGVGAKVLTNLGVEPNRVRAAVEFIMGRGESTGRGEVGLTAKAKRVIELAVDEAHTFGHSYIGTEHLLIGLLREGEGIASGVLESLGVSLEKVRAETNRLLNRAVRVAEGERKLSIRISLASPEQIRSWSHGEVTKPKIFNKRTLKLDRDGLFSEVIFGPTKDFECACGKYKGQRYKGIICDKCGVELAKAKVRRERIGHIELAAPVTHIWFLKGTPSYLGLLLDMPPRKLEELGAEAISEMLESLDLDKLRDEVLKEIELTSNKSSKKAVQRLRAVEGFRRSETRPEATIITVLPVLPAGLRPEKADVLNACYLRVIRHNNHLRRLLDIAAPEADIRKTKSRLQKAVDCLIGNLLDNMLATCSGYFPPPPIVHYTESIPEWLMLLAKKLQSLALAIEILLGEEEKRAGLELPW